MGSSLDSIRKTPPKSDYANNSLRSKEISINIRAIEFYTAKQTPKGPRRRSKYILARKSETMV